MAKKHQGACACGAVTFEFDTDPDFVANCYCKDCQKAAGGSMATFFAVPEDDFTLLSGQPKSFHYIANSGNGLDRNFCPECGSRLFTSNLQAFPGAVFVAIGSLTNADHIAPKLEMFTSRRLDWTSALDVPQFAGMPA
ncbi:GFA family protein [Dyella sp. C11]|uniref:GFA family protein n=1 Tax=Dyella sp. C11 TaxID=2126991 RepID=UPI000D657B00|nr:GFA family protein [Dyella sp. C11]